jgi:signal peptidase I
MKYIIIAALLFAPSAHALWGTQVWGVDPWDGENEGDIFFDGFEDGSPPRAFTVTQTVETLRMQVNGASMEPRLANGETIMVDQYRDVPNALVNGDIVIFEFAAYPTPIVKVVSGLPGQKVSFTSEGYLEVEGALVMNNEGATYHFSADARQRILKSCKQGLLKEDQFIVLSENVASRYDSRRFGVVFQNQIVGKIQSNSQSLN